MAQATKENGFQELEQLEPSPVEETPVESGKGEYFTISAASSEHRANRSSTSTLGLSSHSLNFYRESEELLKC